MFDGGPNNRRGAELAVQVKRMAAFIDAPTVVFTASHQVSRFPKVLAVIADPDLTGLFVNRQPPRIAQTAGPIFGSRIFQPDEGIVLGHGVRLPAVRVINVNAKNAAVKLA